MEITTLHDVIKAREWDSTYEGYGFHTVLDNIERRLQARLPEGDAIELTSLQSKALNDDKLWRPSNPGDPAPNIIIQGATSAGKTLISELAILDALMSDNDDSPGKAAANPGKALVLVPLKAMVRERFEHFAADFNDAFYSVPDAFGAGDAKHPYRIYASSGDFMDNDENLIIGEYELGILVYEKLFSMLNQPNCNILDGCNLIVVDELSMLSNNDRGPKLEIALEIVRRLKPDIRIMCLATCDCKATKVATWLAKRAGCDNMECHVITSNERPLGLEEHIVSLDGRYALRHIRGERESSADAAESSDEIDYGTIELPDRGRVDTRRGVHAIRDARNNLLRALLQEIYKNLDAKVLVLVPSRSAAVWTAENLRRTLPDLFTKHELAPEIVDRLQCCDHDEDRDKLSDLMRNGIAYHHSGVAICLRELIEDAFAAHLKLIVATETLAVGVNLPFDVMIMTDCRMYRGEGRPVRISNQEYRNYIGRAGRLGNSNACGSSYLITEKSEDAKYFLDAYGKPEAIESALKGIAPEQRAPYILGMLHGSKQKDFSLDTIRKQHERSFACASGEKACDAEAIVASLEDAGLCQSKAGFDAAGHHASPSYALTSLGEAVAPYALHPETIRRISYYFLEDHPGESLPRNTMGTTLADDTYLLEILYRICNHAEVAESASLIVSTESDKQRKVRERVVSLLGTMAEERSMQLWSEDGKQQTLGELLHVEPHDLIASEAKFSAALRSIILYRWARGASIPEIRELIGCDGAVRIVAGDLQRLAEVVSYHLEAVYQSLATTTGVLSDEEAFAEFYSLRVRIRYGMSRNLAVLASKHVHGLDRARLLLLEKEAAKEGVSPIESLFVLPHKTLLTCVTPQQLTELRQLVSMRYHCDKLEYLIEKMRQDMGADISDEDLESLKDIRTWAFDNADAACRTITRLLGTARGVHTVVRNTWYIEIGTSVISEYALSIILRGEDTRTRAEALRSGMDSEKSADRAIAIVPMPDSADANAPLQVFMESYRGHRARLLAMDSEFFAMLLASVLYVGQRGAAGKDGASSSSKALANFLADAAGAFSSDDIHDFSLLNYLPAPKPGASTDPDVRILYNYVVDSSASYTGQQLESALETGDDALTVERVPWHTVLEGDELYRKPLIILLDREHIMRCHGISKTLYALRQSHQLDRERSLILVHSDQERDTWSQEDDSNPSSGLSWYKQLDALPIRVAPSLDDAVQHVRSLVDKKRPTFQIGVIHARHDPTDRPDGSGHGDADTEKLDRIVRVLAEKYGRSAILYDGFSEHEHLFHGMDARKKTLDAYRECKVYVVLNTYQTNHNDNCREEIRVARTRCESNEADCLALTPVDTRPQDTPLFDPDDYITPLDAKIDEVKRIVGDKLTRLDE